VLRARRRARVDIAVLSHPHPDHFTGLASALPNLEVGEFWDTGQGEAESAGPVYANLLASLRARGIPIRRPAELCNEPRHFGSAELRVLAPCPSFVPGRDANDNSFVIQIRFGERGVILTGDAEAPEESELVARYGASLRSDLLKVGHHGSRTSSSAAFLGAVRPEVALISCGVRNRFGHPHRPTLEALGERAIHTLRTDLAGGIGWATDGKHVWLSASD
jgi:competence protein ComEC